MFLGQGTVVRSVGSFYRVLLKHSPDKPIECTLRGKIRLQNLKTTNPIAVGDKVLISRESTGEPVITEILPRTNYILRKATNLSKQEHILCANIDQLLLIITLSSPATTLGFIDRILVTAEAYHIPTRLIINKIDLIPEAFHEELKKYINIYESIGYDVYALSALDINAQDTIRDILSNRISFLIGLSGSGKSTIINRAEPSLNLKVGSLSNFSNQGKHITTFAEMHQLPNLGGAVINAPGVREFSLTGFQKNEIGQWFPEIRSRMHQCKFSNCLHLNEPACAVKEAVQNQKIATSRYNSYVGMLQHND